MTAKPPTVEERKFEEWVLFGRTVGKASSWSDGDSFDIVLHNFVPAEGCKIPAGDTLFRMENGTVEQYADDGTITLSMDLIDAVKECVITRIR